MCLFNYILYVLFLRILHQNSNANEEEAGNKEQEDGVGVDIQKLPVKDIFQLKSALHSAAGHVK